MNKAQKEALLKIFKNIEDILYSFTGNTIGTDLQDLRDTFVEHQQGTPKKSVEASLRDRIFYIGNEIPGPVAHDHRAKFVVLGCPQDVIDETDQSLLEGGLLARVTTALRELLFCHSGTASHVLDVSKRARLILKEAENFLGRTIP